MKICTKCGINKEDNEYSKSTTKRNNKIYNYLASWCRKCSIECTKQRKNNDINKHNIERKKIQKNVAIKRRLIKQKLVEYLGGYCQFCGYNKNISSLEFHHKNPNIKEIEISNIIRKDMKNFKIDNIKEELDKCILLCANCHQELHSDLEIIKFSI